MFDIPVFEDQFQQRLPADTNRENTTRQVEGACYSFVEPKKASAPQLIAISHNMADELDFSPAFRQSDAFIQAFVGNSLLPGMQPYAMCYGGHQFGNWAGQLGDGRAINLGERIGRNNQRWQLQLKGAGPTPYSRFADGLAVLRSSLREFLCSEAMHHLGIPTTRALSLIGTGDLVERDMFYDGHPQMEPGAVVCRVAPSFLRFGNYEIFTARKDIIRLRTLVEYTIQQHFTGIYPIYQKDPKHGILRWFSQVSELTCDLVVQWMRVGFVHGVLNTDNMSILGLTIDYGPYGWLDNFDPHWTPNTTDAHQRRYRFANQPPIAQWNLLQLANAIYPLIESAPELEAILQGFATNYQTRWLAMMRGKLGLENSHKDDEQMVLQLEKLLAESQLDMTLFYRALPHVSSINLSVKNEVADHLRPIAYDNVTENMVSDWQSWFNRYNERLGYDNTNEEKRKKLMRQSNPMFILRNYLAQQAIDKAYEGDFSELHRLLEALQTPYEAYEKYKDYYTLRPDWAKSKAGCSMLSCSS